MKKLFIAALAMAVSTTAFAIDNEPEEGITTQVNFGMSVSRLNNKDMKMDGKVGGTLGFKLEYMLPNAHGTYVNAGLDWMMKGAKKSYDISILGQDYTSTDKIRTHYIQLPIHVGFRYNIMPDLGVYGEIGPYFAMGLAGKNITELDADGSWTAAYEQDYNIFKSSKTRPNFQRWDAGFGFRLGCEYMEHYSLNLGCDWGITDMWRNDYRDAVVDAGGVMNDVRNFNMTLTFGYRF